MDHITIKIAPLVNEINRMMRSLSDEERYRAIRLLYGVRTHFPSGMREPERHLRRDVIDNFLRGKAQDEDELRDAVSWLCERLGEAGEQIWLLQRQPKPLPRRIRPGHPRHKRADSADY